MKILIVNAFKKNYEGRKKFEAFVAIIREIYLKQRISLADQPEIICRDMDTLDDYLYEAYTNYSDPIAEKLFDSLDFVFIDGDAQILPWQKRCQKLGMLFKMCKKTNKTLFAAGLGMGLLIYFCATTFEEIQVINGGTKGTPLAQIKEVPAHSLAKIQRYQVFLDNLTGDMYAYIHEKQEWRPQGNVGMHYSRATASLGGPNGADNIKKVQHYHAKASKNQQMLFFSKLTDVKCIIKKQYVSHWICEGLPQEFVVDNRNTWDPHPVNITNVELVKKNYESLADSERGPQIVEHCNSIVIQFNVEKGCKESLTILLNFIKKKMAYLQCVDRLDLKLEQAQLEIRCAKFQAYQQLRVQSPDVRSPPSKTKMRPSTAAATTGGVTDGQGSGQKFTKEFKHSGLGYSHRRACVVVDNNAVSKDPIVAATQREQIEAMKKASLSNHKFFEAPPKSSFDGGMSFGSTFTRNSKMMSAQPSTKDLFTDRKVTFEEGQYQRMVRPNSQVRFGIAQDTLSNESAISIGKMQQKPHPEIVTSISTKGMRDTDVENLFRRQLEKDKQNVWKNQREVRQLLHPTLCEEFLPPPATASSHLMLGSKSTATLNKDGRKASIDQTPSRALYSLYKDFQKMPQYSYDVPIIRNASAYISNEEQHHRKELMMDKKNWLKPDNFKSYFGRNTTDEVWKIVPNYVSKDPSKPPMLHSYRDEDRTKWLENKKKRK